MRYSVYMAEEKTHNYATFWQRIKAGFIDLAILMPIFFLQQGAYFGQTGKEIPSTISYEIAGLITTTLWFAYFLIMYVEYGGQTIGKRKVGIRVIMADGSKLTYGNALVRMIGEYVSSAVLFLGYFSIIWNKKKQGWHDRIAQTLVVKI